MEWATSDGRLRQPIVFDLPGANSRTIHSDMTKGYLFPTIFNGPERSGPRRGNSPLSAFQITEALKSYAHQAAGVRHYFLIHSFRSGVTITYKCWWVKSWMHMEADAFEFLLSE